MNRLLQNLLAAFVLALSLGAVADDIDDIGEAENAIKAKDYTRAMGIFKPLAESGDPEAMLGMGRIYRDGMGVEKNADTALAWFAKAATIWNQRAKEGDPRAWASLGIMFSKGLGYQQDIPKAQEYFKYAFDQAQPKALAGDVESQHLIGMLYSSGKGVPKDIIAGVDWLTKAGEGGNTTAMRMLVHIFDCGCRGLPKDLDKVQYWRAKLAAAKPS